MSKRILVKEDTPFNNGHFLFQTIRYMQKKSYFCSLNVSCGYSKLKNKNT
jgi:hypothetical protein